MSFILFGGYTRFKLRPTDTDLPRGRRDTQGRTLKALPHRSDKRGKRPKFNDWKRGK